MFKKWFILIFCFLSVSLGLDIAGSAVLTTRTENSTFQFEFSSKDKSKAMSLSEQLPGIIEILKIFYGDKFKLADRVVVKILSEKEFKDKPAGKNFPFPFWQENIELSPRAFSEGWNPGGVLAHELSHSVIKNNYGRFMGLVNPVPRWLDEGIACQFNMAGNMWTDENLKNILKEYPQLPVDAGFLYKNDVFDGFGKKDKMASRKIYCVARGIVSLIIDKTGFHNFLKFLDDAAKKKDIDEALKKYTGMNGRGIYDKYIKNLTTEETSAIEYSAADLHNDILLSLLQDTQYLVKNQPGQQMSFETIKAGYYNLLTFALWLPEYFFDKRSGGSELMHNSSWWDTLKKYRFQKRSLLTYCFNAIKGAFKGNEDYIFINGKKDLDLIENDKKTGILLGIEGLHMIDSTEDIKWLYENGVRIFGLTWNENNKFAGYHKSKGGLTAEGKELVKNIVEIGGIIDVAHSSEQTIFDVIETTGGKYPIIASHTGAKGISDMSRNLSDEAIKSIAGTGGVAGVIFYKVLLTKEKGEEEKLNVSVEGVLDTINYIAKISSVDNVALGSDYGLIVPPAGLEDAGCVRKIVSGLLSRGYSPESVKKIMSGNVFRVLKKIMDPRS